MGAPKKNRGNQIQYATLNLQDNDMLASGIGDVNVIMLILSYVDWVGLNQVALLSKCYYYLVSAIYPSEHVRFVSSFIRYVANSPQHYDSEISINTLPRAIKCAQQNNILLPVTHPNFYKSLDAFLDSKRQKSALGGLSSACLKMVFNQQRRFMDFEIDIKTNVQMTLDRRKHLWNVNRPFYYTDTMDHFIRKQVLSKLPLLQQTRYKTKKRCANYPLIPYLGTKKRKSSKKK